MQQPSDRDLCILYSTPADLHLLFAPDMELQTLWSTTVTNLPASPEHLPYICISIVVIMPSATRAYDLRQAHHPDKHAWGRWALSKAGTPVRAVVLQWGLCKVGHRVRVQVGAEVSDVQALRGCWQAGPVRRWQGGVGCLEPATPVCMRFTHLGRSAVCQCLCCSLAAAGDENDSTATAAAASRDDAGMLSAGQGSSAVCWCLRGSHTGELE